MRLPPFAVTRPAIDQIEAVGGCVRIDLEPGGCSGSAYAWSVDPPRDGDEVYGCEGAWLAVSADAAAVLPGAMVDYGAALRPPRFRVVRNPNTAERCACNRSPAGRGRAAGNRTAGRRTRCRGPTASRPLAGDP